MRDADLQLRARLRAEVLAIVADLDLLDHDRYRSPAVRRVLSRMSILELSEERDAACRRLMRAPGPAAE